MVWVPIEDRNPPATGTFVVDTTGRIAWRSVTAEYRWRVGPEEVLAALRDLAAAR